MVRHFFVFFGILVSLNLSAQVQNNSFKDRIHLPLDSPLLNSTTAKATVEWACVNKALTNKCLVYHNDQWFYFVLDTPGDYYLNIAGQKCRDRRGVQVLIIEGNPCETQDYRILECVSEGLQNDVFIPLKSLKSGIPYLVNIDGFLGDYCDFTIQVATKPLGLPLHYASKDTIGVKSIQEGRVVEVRWVVPKERIELYTSFNVYKKKTQDKRTVLHREMGVERNAYGVPVLHYSFIDTLLTQGEYQYSIFGIQKETMIPIMVSENKVRYFENDQRPKPSQRVVIPLTGLLQENFEVMVYDQVNSSMLAKYKAYVATASARELEVDLGDYTARGLKSFMILIVDQVSGERKETYYFVDRTGKLIKE